MSRILILKNVSHEGPGLIETCARECGVSLDIVDLDRGQTLPAAEGYQALIVLGGPDSANDGSPKIEGELSFIRSWFDCEKPFLGICLGLQLMVKALNGRVIKSELKETGFRGPDRRWYEVSLPPEGKKDPLFEGLGASFRVLQLHGEKVIAPPSVSLLGEGSHCREQVFKARPGAYGIQCHFEGTRELLEQWAGTDHDFLKLDRRDLFSDYEEIEQEYETTGRRLIMNFMKIAGIIRKGENR